MMRKMNKGLLLLLLLPTLAIAGFDDEEGDPGVVPDDPGSITTVINGDVKFGGGGSPAPSNPNNYSIPIRNLEVVIDVDGGTGSKLKSNTPGFSTTLSQMPTFSGLMVQGAPVTMATEIFVQTDPRSGDNKAAAQKVLDDLAQNYKVKNGVGTLTVPSVVKGAVVNKTVALGYPAGLLVAENPLQAGTNNLTTKSQEFFNTITLHGGDLAIVVGTVVNANAVAAQLIKNGAKSDQVLVAPAANLDNPNTVAVYLIRLPTMVDLFTLATNNVENGNATK